MSPMMNTPSLNQILEVHHKLVLSDRDRDLFLQLLVNPPQPNQALKKAMKQFELEYETDKVED